MEKILKALSFTTFDVTHYKDNMIVEVNVLNRGALRTVSFYRVIKWQNNSQKWVPEFYLLKF